MIFGDACMCRWVEDPSGKRYCTVLTCLLSDVAWEAHLAKCRERRYGYH